MYNEAYKNFWSVQRRKLSMDHRWIDGPSMDRRAVNSAHQPVLLSELKCFLYLILMFWLFFVCSKNFMRIKNFFRGTYGPKTEHHLFHGGPSTWHHPVGWLTLSTMGGILNMCPKTLGLLDHLQELLREPPRRCLLTYSLPPSLMRSAH